METSQKQLKDFVRGKGLTVDDIEFREDQREEYGLCHETRSWKTS